MKQTNIKELEETPSGQHLKYPPASKPAQPGATGLVWKPVYSSSTYLFRIRNFLNMFQALFNYNNKLKTCGAESSATGKQIT